jgi:hypothetical protein
VRLEDIVRVLPLSCDGEERRATAESSPEVLVGPASLASLVKRGDKGIERRVASSPSPQHPVTLLQMCTLDKNQILVGKSANHGISKQVVDNIEHFLLFKSELFGFSRCGVIAVHCS